MQDRWFKAGLVAICLAMSLGWSTPVLATNYTVFPDDSGCSLTNALKAINEQESLIKKDGVGSPQWITTDPAKADKVICEAGSGNDTINLMPQDEGYFNIYKASDFTADANRQAVTDWLSRFSGFADYKAAATYQLPGQIDVGDADTNVNLTLQIYRKVFDKTIYDNTIVKAKNNERAVFVHAGSALTLRNVTLEGSCPLPTDADPYPVCPPSVSVPSTRGGNGGIIYAQGNVNLYDGSRLVGGKAVNGGGIYLDGSLNLTFENAFISNNTATGNGGGVGMSATSKVIVVGSQFNIFGNSATGNGGGIYLDGESADLGLAAGTFYKNTASEGAAIDLQAGYAANSSRSSKLNNVTLLDNTGAGAALHYADLCQLDTTTTPPTCKYAPPGAYNTSTPPVWESKRVDLLSNSVMVGGGCSMTFDPSNTTSSSLADYLENAYSITGAGSGCPAAEQWMSLDGGPATGNGGGKADSATASVLTGEIKKGAVNAGAACDMTQADCAPITFGKQHYRLQGFMPTAPAVGAAIAYPTLVNGGSPDDATSYLCAPTDERGQSRSDRCDAGAVELAIAGGVVDNIDGVTTGETTWLDVVKNDLGDVTIDCSPAPNTCLKIVVQSRYDSNPQLVCTAEPLPDVDDEGKPVDTPVYKTTTKPALVPCTDSGSYPLIAYQSAPGFHGQDQFSYRIDSGALSGATVAGVDPSAQVNLTVAPVDDFPSKDITDFKSGGVGIWWLLGLLSLGMIRRDENKRATRKAKEHKRVMTRVILTVVLFSLWGVAQASDIHVTTTADTVGGGEGDKCSLRDALDNAFDNDPFAHPNCEYGAPGTDTIILPEGTITLVSNLNISQNNSVIIQGVGVGKSIIDGGGASRISTSSSLALKYLTVQKGSASQGGAIFTSNNLTLERVELKNNKADDRGGAIFLNYGSDVASAHTLSINASYIHGNTADFGGAISTVGQSQKLYLSITNSTFDSNKATAGEGGAIDANLAQDSKLDVINSIFTANTSTTGASAIDLSDANSSAQVNLLNDTFYDNTGGNFLDIGNATNVNLSHAIIAGAAIGCSSGTGQLKGDYYNLFADSAGSAEPTTCSATQPTTNDVTIKANVSAELGSLVPNMDATALAAAYDACKTKYDLAPTGTITEAEQANIDACKLQVDTSGYYPNLFKVTPPLTTPPSSVIVDKGNPAAQGAGNSTPSACRLTDMRDKLRSVGAACDLGAYEVQRITAKDDTVSTLTSRNDGVALDNRQARVDVLANDIPEDDASIVRNDIGFVIMMPDGTTTTRQLLPLQKDEGIEVKNIAGVTLSTTPATPAPIDGIHGRLFWVETKKGDPDCTSASSNCGLLFEYTKGDLDLDTSAGGIDALTDPNDPDSHPYNLSCPDNDTPKIVIPYTVKDDGGHEATANLSITLTNLPPQFSQSSITVYTKPDEPVSIPLDVVDPDGKVDSISLADNGDPLFARESSDLAYWKNKSQDGSIHPSWYDPSAATPPPPPPEGSNSSVDMTTLPKANNDRATSGLICEGCTKGSVTNPVIVYRRGNVSQVFNDTFVVQVKDNCGATSSVVVHVNFPKPGDSGGQLIGGGSLGWGLVLLFGLGLVRRRRDHGSLL